MNDRKNMWVGVGVVVVAILAIGGGIYWFIHRGGSEGPLPVHAPAGQVVAGFPQEMILDAPAGTGSGPGGITNSYSLTYSASTNQYTAEWNSSSTPSQIFADYQSYMASHGWTVGNTINSDLVKMLYATQGASVFSVTIQPLPQGDAGAKVTAGYVDQLK